MLLSITVARLWLSSVQRLWVAGGPYDDWCFAKHAFFLKRFAWLGPFDDYTLIKGPGYPIFLAVVSAVHLPLTLAHQLFNAMACAVFILAVRRFIRPRSLLALLYF